MELRIPPPLLALILAVLMWAISKMGHFASIELEVITPLSIFVLVVGFAIDISAVISFRMANTTINPLKPEKTRQLVKVGIYKKTRNPMYVGLFLILCSWALWLGNYFAFPILFFFVWYMTKFQIIPEEQMLKALFPEDFESYQLTVRRWI